MKNMLKIFGSEFTAYYHHIETLIDNDCPANALVLFYVAVEPKYQRKGLGSSVLQPVLQTLDYEKTLSWIYTHSEAAVEFFMKNGYSLRTNQKAPVNYGKYTGPSIWTMVRKPCK